MLTGTWYTKRDPEKEPKSSGVDFSSFSLPNLEEFRLIFSGEVKLDVVEKFLQPLENVRNLKVLKIRGHCPEDANNLFENQISDILQNNPGLQKLHLELNISGLTLQTYCEQVAGMTNLYSFGLDLHQLKSLSSTSSNEGKTDFEIFMTKLVEMNKNLTTFVASPKARRLDRFCETFMGYSLHPEPPHEGCDVDTFTTALKVLGQYDQLKKIAGFYPDATAAGKVKTTFRSLDKSSFVKNGGLYNIHTPSQKCLDEVDELIRITGADRRDGGRANCLRGRTLYDLLLSDIIDGQPSIVILEDQYIVVSFPCSRSYAIRYSEAEVLQKLARFRENRAVCKTLKFSMKNIIKRNDNRRLYMLPTLEALQTFASFEEIIITDSTCISFFLCFLTSEFGIKRVQLDLHQQDVGIFREMNLVGLLNGSPAVRTLKYSSKYFTSAVFHLQKVKQLFYTCGDLHRQSDLNILKDFFEESEFETFSFEFPSVPPKTSGHEREFMINCLDSSVPLHATKFSLRTSPEFTLVSPVCPKLADDCETYLEIMDSIFQNNPNLEVMRVSFPLNEDKLEDYWKLVQEYLLKPMEGSRLREINGLTGDHIRLAHQQVMFNTKDLTEPHGFNRLNSRMLFDYVISRDTKKEIRLWYEPRIEPEVLATFVGKYRERITEVKFNSWSGKPSEDIFALPNVRMIDIGRADCEEEVTDEFLESIKIVLEKNTTPLLIRVHSHPKPAELKRVLALLANYSRVHTIDMSAVAIDGVLLGSLLDMINTNTSLKGLEIEKVSPTMPIPEGRKFWEVMLNRDLAGKFRRRILRAFEEESVLEEFGDLWSLLVIMSLDDSKKADVSLQNFDAVQHIAIYNSIISQNPSIRDRLTIRQMSNISFRCDYETLRPFLSAVHFSTSKSEVSHINCQNSDVTRMIRTYFP